MTCVLYRNCCVAWQEWCQHIAFHCRLRKIYIDERLSLHPAEGPQNSQAAQIMGNSVKAWRTHYDLNCSMRECQAAADSSSEWRSAMLASALKKKASDLEKTLFAGDIIEID